MCNSFNCSLQYSIPADGTAFSASGPERGRLPHRAGMRHGGTTIHSIHTVGGGNGDIQSGCGGKSLKCGGTQVEPWERLIAISLLCRKIRKMANENPTLSASFLLILIYLNDGLTSTDVH
jgi:hypothetical protein